MKLKILEENPIISVKATVKTKGSLIAKSTFINNSWMMRMKNKFTIDEIKVKN